jgi:hypothetical protein
LSDLEKECNKNAFVAKDTFKWHVTKDNIHVEALAGVIEKILEQGDERTVLEMFSELDNSFAQNCLQEFRGSEAYHTYAQRLDHNDNETPNVSLILNHFLNLNRHLPLS